MKLAYGRLLNATGRVVGQAKRFSREIGAGVKHSIVPARQVVLEGHRQLLDEMLPRVQQVIRQTKARIFRGDSRSEGKIVSLFGGDWSDGANWTPVGPALPTPGPDDIAFFGELPGNYTVNVTTLVGVEAMIIDPTTPFTGDPTFSISGSLTTEFLDYATAFGGPATSMTINAGGSLDITTTLVSIRIPETITIAGGELVLGSPLVGDTGSNVNFDFENTAGPNGSNTGVIQIDATGAGPGGLTTQTIGDVANGDKFVLPDENFFPGSTVTLTGNVLTVLLGGVIPVFTMENISLAPGFTGTFLASGDVIQAVCYARGTMIRTPDGELPVEKLRPGKQVITLVDGEEVPQTVTWLGHRRINLAGHPRPETVAPIRILRDAFADGMPHRDLVVSPDHAIFVDGKLICARQLVNGTTIRQERDWTAVDYYHVELDQHAILLAEGLPAESYIDTGNSGFFANSGAAHGAASGPDRRV